jgi:hypothetical protein
MFSHTSTIWPVVEFGYNHVTQNFKALFIRAQFQVITSLWTPYYEWIKYNTSIQVPSTLKWVFHYKTSIQNVKTKTSKSIPGVILKRFSIDEILNSKTSRIAWIWQNFWDVENQYLQSGNQQFRTVGQAVRQTESGNILWLPLCLQ